MLLQAPFFYLKALQVVLQPPFLHTASAKTATCFGLSSESPVSAFSLSQSSLPFFHLLQSPQIAFQAFLLEIKYLNHFGPWSLKCLAPYNTIAVGLPLRSRSQRPILHVLQGFSVLQCLIFSICPFSLWRFLLDPFLCPSSSVLKIETAGCNFG